MVERVAGNGARAGSIRQLVSLGVADADVLTRQGIEARRRPEWAVQTL